jgi:hypothetical protein
MIGIGIRLHQVLAKLDGETIATWGPYRNPAEAQKMVRDLAREDREYVAENPGAKGAQFSIFSADADFFA